MGISAINNRCNMLHMNVVTESLSCCFGRTAKCRASVSDAEMPRNITDKRSATS